MKLKLYHSGAKFVVIRTVRISLFVNTKSRQHFLIHGSLVCISGELSSTLGLHAGLLGEMRQAA